LNTQHGLWFNKPILLFEVDSSQEAMERLVIEKFTHNDKKLL
jgi:hypothetical protein